MTETIDSITLAVLAGRMEQIADEMDATLFRAAFNPIIAEAHDASHGLYHPVTGDTLVQGKSGLPIFVGVMSFAVKAVIDRAAEAGDFADGDVWIFNDAHIGGTHLNDMRLVRPFFHDGKPFCYLASVGHWHDLGGGVPGNYNPAATDAFQEAFRGEYDVNAVASSGSTENIPVRPAHDINMNTNCTFTFSAPSTEGHTFVLYLSGAFTPTFPSKVDWANNTPPTYNNPSVYVFSTLDGGSSYIGAFVGGGFA